MGDGRDLGRNAAEDVSRRQINESSSAAVDEVFVQWQMLQSDPNQISAFTEELAPYLPQLSVAFLNTAVEIDGVTTTYFDAIDTSGDGVIQDSELMDFSQNTTDGAARMFADYLLQHYSAFDASDGSVTDGGINGESVLRSPEGFYNNADGSYTRLTEDGLFETTYPDGVVLIVRENSGVPVGDSLAVSAYIVPGPPEAIVENHGGLYVEVTVNGVTTSFNGAAEHTADGVVVTETSGVTTTYQTDGMVIARDSEGRVLSVSNGDQVLSRYVYDGGSLVEFWDGDVYYWMDRRPLSGTWGTWYVSNSDDGVTQVSNVSMAGDNANIVFADGTIKMIHQNGDVTWSQGAPLSEAADANSGTTEAGSSVSMSVTRNANNEIVEVVIPPSTEPWHRVEYGDSEPPEYRWMQSGTSIINGERVGPVDAWDPTIQFTDNGTNIPDVQMTYTLDGGGTRQISRNGEGTLISVTNPDGSSFQRQADGSYLYYPPAVDGQTVVPLPATVSEATGEPVFTILGLTDMTLYAFHADGTMTSTRVEGDNVYTSQEQNLTESIVHMEGQTVTRRDGFIEIVTDAGATTRYQDNHDGTWTVVTGNTDESGVFHQTAAPGFVRGGWAADGTFILFTDGDQNPNTFDPGDTYHRIEANGSVTEHSIANGSISFTDESGFVNTMEFVEGQITSLMQTTPDGQHQLTVEFVDGNMASIQLPDGTEIVPVTEGNVTRWQHTGTPPYFLADAPVLGANGQILLGTSSIWQMQESTDPLYPGQMILQIRTDNGFAYHAMDGSYAIEDANQISMYSPSDVLSQQVFGNNRRLDEAVVLNYESGALVSIDLPGAGAYCHLVGGVWYYSDGVQEVPLNGAPQIDSESGIVTLNFLEPAAGEPIGIRIGAFPFSETLLADGVVRNTSADGTVTTDHYPSGAVIQSVNGQTTSVMLANGAHYEQIPDSGNPPSWSYTHNGVTQVVQGNITFSPDGSRIVIENGTEQTIFWMEAGAVTSVQHTEGTLTTITNLNGDQILSVTMVDANNTAETNQLVAREVDGVTVWHWIHNGEDIALSRNTSVTLDAEGGVVFENDTLAEANQPLIGEAGWQVPQPTGFNFEYSDSPANTQLSIVTLPDGQGTWSLTPEGQWQFTAPNGETVTRSGTLSYENGVVTFVSAGVTEVYTYAASGGALQSIAITDATGNVTTALYENGEIVSVSLPAHGTMQFQGDFWTVTVGGNTINVLGEPAIVCGQLVMQNSNASIPVAEAGGVMQFRTVEGVVSFDSNGQMVATDEAALLSSLAADSTWIAGVAGEDGLLSLTDMQAALSNSALSQQEKDVLLYLIENYNELQPLYDQQTGTLTLVNDGGVEIYGPNPNDVLRLSSEELILMVNPNQTSPSLWTTLAPNGVLTRESLDSIVATGSINGYTLTPLERAAAVYLQAHWDAVAGQQGEDMQVAGEIRVSSLISYARTHGINFPDTAEVEAEPSEVAAEEVPAGQPVEVTSLQTSASDTESGVVSEIPPNTYVAVEWLNQHQLVMRQFMVVDENGQRTGAIDQARVDAQVQEFESRGYENLSADEQRLYDSLKAMQAYFETSQPPYMSEDFLSSILLSGDAAGNDIGARTLQPGDTVWSMARRFLVEQYCLEHGLDPVEQMQLIEQGYGANAELATYVNANLQAEIDFIFEANHIVGNNVANGQLLILDPALAAQSNDAIYLAPQDMNLEAYTEVPAIEGQSEHVTHLQNPTTGEEAYILDSGITLTRTQSGNWGAYDENGNFLGTVENDIVDPNLIASGNFVLQLESNGDVPIQSIAVTDYATTIVFENNSSEQLYNNGIHVNYNPSLEVDQVVVPTPLGSITYTRLSANGETTGYQVTYPDGTTETVAQAPLPAEDGAITILSSNGGQAFTLNADGSSNHSSIGFSPVDEVDEGSEEAA